MPAFAAHHRRTAMICLTLLSLLLATMITTSSARSMTLADITTGLEGRWPLNDAANPTADTSGNGHHGTLSGSPIFTSDAPASLAGTALDFDGVDDAMIVSGPESAFDLNVMTVAVWINVDAFTKPSQAIVTKGEGSWRLQRHNDTNQIHFATNGLSNQLLISTIAVNDNQWHHVAAVYDGSTKYLYIDGSLNAATPATGTIATNDFAPAIGMNGQFPDRWFDGQMDDVRIYSRALSAADVADLYAYTNSPPTPADDSYATGEETPLTVAAPGVLRNDRDPDSDVLTATLRTAPAHGAIQFNANGSFAYTPTLNFTGVDTFTYAASDVALASAQAATVTLMVSPRTTLSGHVTDTGHGWGLYARIDVVGGAIPPVFTNPATGAYTVTLVQSAAYTITATALIPGYVPATYGFTAPVGGGTQNFALPPSAACVAPGYGFLASQNTTCAPKPGGMVVGNVYDANTQIGLNGAAVNGPGIATGSAATAADPNVADGFYYLFAPAGTVELTASLALYTRDQASVSVTNTATTQHDFHLGAPLLAAQPAAATVVLAHGQVATRTVTLVNAGTADASVALLAYAGTSLPGMTGAPARDAVAGAPRDQPVDPAASPSRVGAAPFPIGWRTVAPLPLAVVRTTVQLVGGQIYVIGGDSSLNNQRLGKVQRYTPATDTWIDTLPAMPLPASNTCSGALGSDIYVVGGTTGGNNNLNAVQIFHTATLTWTTAISDPLPGVRAGQQCAVHDGKLYVFGGVLNVVDGQTTGWVYTPGAAAGSRWSSIAAMPEAMAVAGTTVINGKIYVGGGQTTASANPTTMYVYDPALNSWSTMTGLQTGRGDAAMWQDGTNLYVGAGGVGTNLSTVEAYDTTRGLTAAWSFSNPLATGRQAPGWVTDTANRRFYAIGGYNGTLLNSVEVLDLPNAVQWLSETPASGTIAAQSSLPIALRFDSTGLAAGAYDAQVVAQVAGSPYIPASPVINVRLIVAVPAVGAGPASMTLSGAPGTIVTHTLTITNSGTYTDSFDLALGAHQWTTTLSQSAVGPLGPGQGATVAVRVTVPANALAGAQEAVSVTAVSQIDGAASASATRITTAGAVYGVQTTPLASAASGAPSAVVSYALTVRNTGNAADTVTLAVTGTTWATMLSRSSIALAPGASSTVVVSVTVPADATSGANSTATITASSQGSAAQTATATVTTTAGQRRLFLPLLMHN